jgi:hypothetical protein
MMIYKALLGIDLHIYNEFATRRIAHFLRRMAALQLLGMGRPKALPEGTREAGIGQRRGCRGRAYGELGFPPPAPGSHLPAEGTAPPCAAAPFRVVASCPAPQKPRTPPRPTARFRIFTCAAFRLRRESRPVWVPSRVTRWQPRETRDATGNR